MWTLTSSRPYQQQPLRASKTNYNPGQLNRKQTVSKTASSKIKNEQESCAPQSLVGCIEKKTSLKIRKQLESCAPQRIADRIKSSLLELHKLTRTLRSSIFNILYQNNFFFRNSNIK